MAKRGPKRRTAAQRVAQGFNATPSTDVDAALGPPSHLKGVALVEFRRLQAILTKAGRMTAAEWPFMVMAAVAWKRFWEFEKDIDKRGLTIKNGSQVITNPSVGKQAIAMGKYSALLVKIGLTAVERQRLGIHLDGPAADKNPGITPGDGKPILRMTRAG